MAIKLKAQKREILGKKVESLRRREMLPAVVFGKEVGSIPITLDQKEFEKVFAEAGESTLIDLETEGGKPLKVLVTEVGTDPLTDQIIHANLQAVKLTEKITASIPIKVVGESPIVKAGEGLLLTLLDEIEVECFPQDLPPEIKVDISNLTEIDQGIAVKELPVDRSKVEIEQDPEDLVVKVEHAEMEEEEEAAEEVPIEEAVEVTHEKPKEEVTPEDEAKEQS